MSARARVAGRELNRSVHSNGFRFGDVVGWFLVTEDVRARIDGEADVARIESWLEAAVTARAIGDVFRDS